MTVSEEGQKYIKLGKLITVKLDNFEIFTGCFESFSESEDVESHDINYSGRDKISTLIDSTIPDNCKNVLNVSSFKSLCELVIKGKKLNIKVIDEVGGTFKKFTTKAGETGQKCGEYLEVYARPLGVIMNTDGKGNLVIKKPVKKLKTLLLNLKNGKENNIKNSTLSYDITDRFHKIIYRSNGNAAFTEEGESYVINNKGETEDKELKEIMSSADFGEKTLEVISDKPMTKEECKKAAQDDVNIRRIRSFQYECTIAGFSANNELWDCGYLVDVKDEIKKVYGTLLIREVNWNNSDNGDIVDLILTYPDGYTGKDNLSGAQKVELPEYVK
jgi:prophage tail gpP-like protein